MGISDHYLPNGIHLMAEWTISTSPIDSQFSRTFIIDIDGIIGICKSPEHALLLLRDYV